MTEGECHAVICGGVMRLHLLRPSSGNDNARHGCRCRDGKFYRKYICCPFDHLCELKFYYFTWNLGFVRFGYTRTHFTHISVSIFKAVI